MAPLANYQIVWLKDGNGVFEVDFQKYLFRGEELLFLSPGQYFRVIEGELEVSRIELVDFFENQNLHRDLLTRVLFSHVIAVGSIQVTSELSSLLLKIIASEGDFREDISAVIDQLLKTSVHTWLKQKPFDPNISKNELDIIFDLKHLIDEHFWERTELSYYNKQLNIAPYKLSQITKTKLNKTPGELERSRVLLEAERKLVFTSESSKEITYDLGFNDPSYFNRFFKKSTGLTTGEFRDSYQTSKSEIFLNDLLELIHIHFREEKSVAFYAEKFNMTHKSLSAKVRRTVDKNVSELIASKVVAESKKLITKTDLQVNEIAFQLGFKDPSHFSHFFKNNTDIYPLDYRQSVV